MAEETPSEKEVTQKHPPVRPLWEIAEEIGAQVPPRRMGEVAHGRRGAARPLPLWLAEVNLNIGGIASIFSLKVPRKG
jgi:hypothetical protein